MDQYWSVALGLGTPVIEIKIDAPENMVLVLCTSPFITSITLVIIFVYLLDCKSHKGRKRRTLRRAAMLYTSSHATQTSYMVSLSMPGTYVLKKYY